MKGLVNGGCATLATGRRTGRSLPGDWETRFTGGGKSELRRAVCRITSGTGACEGTWTASATENIPPAFTRKSDAGKGEKVR